VENRVRLDSEDSTKCIGDRHLNSQRVVGAIEEKAFGGSKGSQDASIGEGGGGRPDAAGGGI